MAKISVMGTGSWGTALAILLHNNGHQVIAISSGILIPGSFFGSSLVSFKLAAFSGCADHNIT